jgi:hypothetical protein
VIYLIEIFDRYHEVVVKILKCCHYILTGYIIFLSGRKNTTFGLSIATEPVLCHLGLEVWVGQHRVGVGANRFIDYLAIGGGREKPQVKGGAFYRQIPSQLITRFGVCRLYLWREGIFPNKIRKTKQWKIPNNNAVVGNAIPDPACGFALLTSSAPAHKD